MSDGHTAEEKIKILYEDSLRDIREITRHLDSVMARLEDANKPNTLLAGISKQVTLLLDLEKSLLYAENSLRSTFNLTKGIHESHIAELLEASKRQLEAVSAEQQDAFIKCIATTSQTEMVNIIKSAEEMKQAVVKGVGEEAIRLVRDRVSRENTTLSEASRSFVETGGKFAQLYTEREGRINNQIKAFGEALDKIIDEKTPSKWDSFLIAIAANVVTVGCIAIFVHFFVK